MFIWVDRVKIHRSDKYEKLIRYGRYCIFQKLFIMHFWVDFRGVGVGNGVGKNKKHDTEHNQVKQFSKHVETGYLGSGQYEFKHFILKIISNLTSNIFLF